MDLSKYVGKYVKIDLFNGHYYEGFVNSVDTSKADTSIEIKDKLGHFVDVKESQIAYIREI